jgi:hypothetical protein
MAPNVNSYRKRHCGENVKIRRIRRSELKEPCDGFCDGYNAGMQSKLHAGSKTETATDEQLVRANPLLT